MYQQVMYGFMDSVYRRLFYGILGFLLELYVIRCVDADFFLFTHLGGTNVLGLIQI
jgi:hypothetical protein